MDDTLPRSSKPSPNLIACKLRFATKKTATISEQQDAVDQLSADNKRLGARLRDIENRLNRDRLNSADPASLVDGTIIDVVGSGDMVYIDRGRNDQIVLGMTFEVYENAAQIQVDEEDSRTHAVRPASK